MWVAVITWALIWLVINDIIPVLAAEVLLLLYLLRGMCLLGSHSGLYQYWLSSNLISFITRPPIAELFSTSNTGESSISRSRSFKRTSMTPPTAIKKNSQCLQLIYQVVCSAFWDSLGAKSNKYYIDLFWDSERGILWSSLDTNIVCSYQSTCLYPTG